MNIYQQIAANKRRSFFAISLFILFIVSISYVFGKIYGDSLSYTAIAFIFSGIAAFGSYYFSDQIILALSSAKPADPKKNFDFFTAVQNMSIASGLPMPKLYVISDTALNAFATGRDPKHAVIVATSGLLDKLERSEIEAVIAHEMSHIKNYDIQFMAIIAILAGMIAYLADFFMRSLWYKKQRSNRRESSFFLLLGIILAVLSPFIATIIKLAVSRNREFLADATGALLTRNPLALASALEKISEDQEVLEVASNATSHLYIINPFKGKESAAWFASLFNTHPPVEERIRILRKM